jgi:hypothetical protein
MNIHTQLDIVMNPDNLASRSDLLRPLDEGNMNSFFCLKRAPGLAAKLSLAIASLGFACGAALGAGSNAPGGVMNNVSTGGQDVRISPSDNNSVGNARVLVADGTSFYESFGADTTKWFTVGIEPGKTYVIDLLDPYEDLGFNFVGTVGVFASDGTSSPPETEVDCNTRTIAPAIEVGNDGVRCIVRAFTPDGTTLQKRGIYISVTTTGFAPQFRIRVSESTYYGRWTTNGYDMHIELQNTTQDPICGQILYYPGTGLTYSGGAWPFGYQNIELTVPAFGAIKYVLPAGTLSHGDNKGTFRVGACNSPVNLMTNSLTVNAFGFNPVTKQFLFFAVRQANQGGQNSW